MSYKCPFVERDGRSYEAGSREAFRRHLTVHHSHDYRRMGNGQDSIVPLTGRELSDRLSAIRRSQRHRKSKQYIPPPPQEFDERPFQVTSVTARSVCVVPPAAESCLPTPSHVNCGPTPIEKA